MKILIWTGLVILYLMLCSILRSALGMGAAYGVITVAIGYGLWVLGRSLTRNRR